MAVALPVQLLQALRKEQYAVLLLPTAPSLLLLALPLLGGEVAGWRRPSPITQVFSIFRTRRRLCGVRGRRRRRPETVGQLLLLGSQRLRNRRKALARQEKLRRHLLLDRRQRLQPSHSLLTTPKKTSKMPARILLSAKPPLLRVMTLWQMTTLLLEKNRKLLSVKLLSKRLLNVKLLKC